MQCSSGDDGRSGGRSSAGCGNAAAALERASWGAGWVPGEVWTTSMCVGATNTTSGHGGEELRRWRESVTDGMVAREGNRARGERG